ncbi:MAG: hypothetical protein ACRD5B_18110, partial [Nitrososphaeraceae archaeon]
MNTEDCDSLLISYIPKEIQAKIIDFVVDKRDKVSPSWLKVCLAALQSFFEINDFEGINWKKIKKFQGEFHTVAEDRPYIREEIAKLLGSAHTLRDKAIILLLSSSGIRSG